MFWYVEQLSIIAIHFNSTYFDQFFNFLKKIVCKTSAAGRKMVSKLILISFAECHESYVPHRWRDFRCPAGYFWSPTAWQRSFYGCRGCSDCWEKWYVNIISLQNVSMIFYQYWSQQNMMAMHAHSQGPVRVRFQQVKWPWNRDVKQQKWRQTTQREVETLTVKYW